MSCARGSRVAMMMLALCVFLPSCAIAPRLDRTEGRSFEFLWHSANRDAAVFATLERDGVLRASGGLKALGRGTSDAYPLSDDEVASLLALAVRAASAERTPAEGADSGRASRSELALRDASGRSEVSADGPDPSLDALRAAIGQITIRRFRSTLEAQPEASDARRDRSQAGDPAR